MNPELVKYVKDAIERLKSKEIYGSHAEGVFSKAAKGFESEFRHYVLAVLKRCNLDYEKDIRSAIKGPTYDKLTLGQQVASLKEAEKKYAPAAFKGRIPELCEPHKYFRELNRINKLWVDVKHRDAEPSEFEAALTSIDHILARLSQSQ